MARNSYYTDPSLKHLDQIMRFDGGLNSTAAEDALADNELPGLVNKELTLRGSTKRRHGIVKKLTGKAGTAQGYFRHYKAGGTYDEIQAVGGVLYVNGVQKTAGLQATRGMEAVQYLDKTYIATGSGLYQWDGATMAKVTPYRPQPLEALYVGLNALADDPTNYLSDGVSAYISILGVTVDKRYGVVNENITATAYVNKPAADTVEYKFEIKLIAEPYDKWVTFRDWSTNKSATFSKPNAGEYELMVSARKQGTTAISSYYSVPKYIIKPTADPKDTEIPHDTIDDCNRILLHWDRLMMYGDPTQPDVLYIAHLKNPGYWPISNSLRFTNPKLEGLTSIVQFRDMIVAFTDTTFQALFGKSPQDYRRVMLNTAVGCIAPYSAKVTGNYITFLSYEGVQIVKSVGMSEDKANVQLISTNVQDDVPADKTAVAEVHDNQYHLVFPADKKRMRYYYQRGVWAKDLSDKFGFNRLFVYNNDLIALEQAGGAVYEFDETVFTDDGYVYEDYLETKAFTFGEPFKKKKIREIQLLTGAVLEATTVMIDFYIDNKLTLSNSVDLAVTTGVPLTINGLVSDKTEVKIAGKGRAVKVVIRHSEANEFHLLGIGFIFKLKTP